MTDNNYSLPLLVYFIMIPFAADSIVTAFIYGSIFEGLRKWMEKRGGLLKDLSECAMCFSYHATFIVTVLTALAIFCPVPLNFISQFVLMFLVATDFVHMFQRVHPIFMFDEEDSNNGSE